MLITSRLTKIFSFVPFPYSRGRRRGRRGWPQRARRAGPRNQRREGKTGRRRFASGRRFTGTAQRRDCIDTAEKRITASEPVRFAFRVDFES